jgi:hypothetical protein
VAVPACAGGREQRPEFFLRDPRGEDLTSGVGVNAARLRHLCTLQSSQTRDCARSS